MITSKPTQPQLVPVQARPTQRKRASKGKDDAEMRSVTPMSLWHAFRRRWIPALAVAIPAALLAAVAAWEMIPANYESYAVVKVNQYNQTLVGRSLDRDANFLNYRDSQIAHLKTRTILSSAIAIPEVAQTTMVSGKTYPVDWLSGKILVDAGDSDEFIKIALAGDDPQELATIVNGVKDTYMDQVVNKEVRKKGVRLDVLHKELKSRKAELERLKKSSLALQKELGSSTGTNLAFRMQLQQQNLISLTIDERKAREALADEEQAREARRRRGLDPDAPIAIRVAAGTGAPGPTANPATAFISSRILTIQRLLQQYESVGSTGAEVDSLREELKQKQNELSGKAGEDGPTMSYYEILKQRHVGIEKDIDTAEKKMKVFAANKVQLESENELIQEANKAKLEIQKLVRDLTVEMQAATRVEEVHDATLPEVRQTKTRSRMTVIAALGMLCAVIAGFTLVEWFAQRIASPSELGKETGLRLIGSLPAPERMGLLGKVGIGEPNYDEWNRVLVESVDVVRTYLLRHLDMEQPNAVVIASASANEGKTTLATQLGSSIARSGRRIAVVDADFRRPSAHLVFKAEQGAGLSEVLRAEADIEDVTRETSVPGLFFISAGNVDDQSLRNLAIDGGESLIAMLKEHFDFVVIDSSPMLFVAEPSMLAQHSDAVLVAVRRDYSRIGFVNQAVETLRNLEAPLVGAVMVGAESTIHRQTYGYQQQVSFAPPV